MINAFDGTQQSWQYDWDNSLVFTNSQDGFGNAQSADMGFNMYAAVSKIVDAIVLTGELGDMQNAIAAFRKAASCSSLSTLVFRINEQIRQRGSELRLDYQRRALKTAIKFELGTITAVFDIALKDRSGKSVDDCMIPARMVRPDQI